MTQRTSMLHHRALHRPKGHPRLPLRLQLGLYDRRVPAVVAHRGLEELRVLLQRPLAPSTSVGLPAAESQVPLQGVLGATKLLRDLLHAPSCGMEGEHRRDIVGSLHLRNLPIAHANGTNC
jgi:hypothetical protein